ncbi:MAG: hypothetical protein H0V12_11720 [Chloroflexi bacterium]|nr:hypothetical protein [Chloroflexota bacterium]
MDGRTDPDRLDASLEHSKLLGRRIRAGAPQALGIPTEEFALDALRRGDMAEARQQLDYAVEEASRVYFIFSTWLRALLDYGATHVDDIDAELERLAGVIGSPPPVVDPQGVGAVEAERAAESLSSGDPPTFEEAFAALRRVQRDVHDAQADWCWGLLTVFRDALGEDRMEEVFRATMSPWLSERYAALASMTPEESFRLTIEGMRAHHCGPNRSGHIDVRDEPDRWVMSFDPCGTGGRMRRGDPLADPTPRTEAPYNFAVTERAHDWSWGEEGVCIYCAHCAVVNEILPIEQTGAPMRVVDYPRDPGDSCRWTIYKSPDLVPAEAYERVGKVKPE